MHLVSSRSGAFFIYRSAQTCCISSSLMVSVLCLLCVSQPFYQINCRLEFWLHWRQLGANKMRPFYVNSKGFAAYKVNFVKCISRKRGWSSGRSISVNHTLGCLCSVSRKKSCTKTNQLSAKSEGAEVRLNTDWTQHAIGNETRMENWYTIYTFNT